MRMDPDFEISISTAKDTRVYERPNRQLSFLLRKGVTAMEFC